MSLRRIGAHVSAAGGVHKAIERAAAIGANTVQVFSGSPRSWSRSPLENLDIDKISSKSQELDVSPIITHSLYLINLASENPLLTQKSTKALVYDLAFDGKLNGGGVVVHLGSHLGRGWVAVREQVATLIGAILNESPAGTFLIENSAGQQGKLASDLSEIRWLLDRLQSQQVGWCLDTCHAFAAGYNLGVEHADTPKSLYQDLDRYNLWSDLKCIHVNDSKDPADSGRDRHANIGEGLIPTDDLQYFLNQEHFKALPLILEVPGQDEMGPDAINVARIKALAEE